MTKVDSVKSSISVVVKTLPTSLFKVGAPAVGP
jgi:hypothetical protein